MSIYQEMKDLGVEIDHHESDLYVPVTDETRKIVNDYEFKGNVTTFVSLVEPNVVWYDIPFAYEPWWEARRS